MRKVVIYTFALAYLLAGPFSARNCLADILGPTVHEIAFIELINDARENPLEAAKAVGLNPQKVLADFPEMEQILKEGLPPVKFDPNLYQAATGHVSDMFENNFYASVGPDGETPTERIAETGYVPKSAGETLGMLAFINLVKAEKAVDIIFANMYRDELDPENDSERNILNPGFKDAAVSLGSGSWSIQGNVFNVYITTCDFASSVTSALEEGILALVNQARVNPSSVAESIGMDPEEILRTRPDLNDVIINGLPPVTFNEKLFWAAEAHSKDMLKNAFFSHESLDGRTLEDRITDRDYPMQTAGEVLGSLITELSTKPFQAAGELFESALRAELRSENHREPVFLSFEFEEAGISFDTVRRITEETDDEGNQIEDFYHLLTADFAAPAIEENDMQWTPPEEAPYIYIVVYEDFNGNGIYEIGEGMSSVVVEIDGIEGCQKVLATNDAGVASASFAPGVYNVEINEVVDEDTVFQRELIVDLDNVGLYVRKTYAQEEMEATKP